MRNKAYRRHMHKVHDKRWRFIIENGGYYPYRGYIPTKLVKDENGFWDWEPYPYIQECSHSKKVKFYKNISNRKVRRTKEVFRNNTYRKVFELWWTLF